MKVELSEQLGCDACPLKSNGYVQLRKLAPMLQDNTESGCFGSTDISDDMCSPLTDPHLH